MSSRIISLKSNLTANLLLVILLSEKKQFSKGAKINKVSMESLVEYLIFKEQDSKAPFAFSCQFIVTLLTSEN